MFFPGVTSRGVCCVVLRQGKRIERRRSISVSSLRTPWSSLRTQGPHNHQRQFAKSVGHSSQSRALRGMGPCFRRDDAVGNKCRVLSPRPACGERSRAKRAGEGDSPRALLLPNLRRLPSPRPSPARAGRGRRKLHRRGGHAAIDHDGLPGHEARGIGAEIGYPHPQSRGSPIRRKGVVAQRCFRRSSSSHSARAKSVLTRPGATQLTRTPFGPTRRRGCGIMQSPPPGNPVARSRWSAQAADREISRPSRCRAPPICGIASAHSQMLLLTLEFIDLVEGFVLDSSSGP